ncbi:hypothetical protein JCGZ_03956 [Jatropha curcas]|uniref:Aminotransferase-like plant mobile domain-containing protein n=1 Tax=Jatropha curcas TaxID=180498 RepID=A0A067JD03_JATCU|nr:hypothetical protein JCGZ_03956 [Jatropha curcas]
MSQTSEIPASAYTPEMEILGALPDIPTFDSKLVPVSRNPLTSGTRPLQLLPLPGIEFPVRYETNRMRGFQAEVDLGKARSGGSSTDAFAFWWTRLCELGSSLQALEIMLPGFAAFDHNPGTICIDGAVERLYSHLHLRVRRDDPDAGRLRCHYRPPLYHSSCSTRCSVPDGYPRSSSSPLSARCHHTDQVHRAGMHVLQGSLPVLGREDQDQAGGVEGVAGGGLTCRSRIYSGGEGPGCSVGSFDWATLALAHLYHGLDVWTRGSGGPSGDALAESRRIPHSLAHCHHTYASGEDPKYWRSFLNDRELSDDLPGLGGGRAAHPSRFLMRGYWADRYFIGERVYDTPVALAHRRVPHAPPRHMCLLEGLTREDLEVEYRGFSANDFLSAGDFLAYFSSRMQARLPEILEYTQEQKMHKTTTHYKVEAAAEAGVAVAPVGPTGVVLGDIPFPPGMEVVLDPGLGLGSGIIISADLRQAPPPVQLDPEHTTHVLAQRYQELCQRFGFARSFIDRLYSERHERDLEIGRLQRHHSRQSSAL